MVPWVVRLRNIHRVTRPRAGSEPWEPSRCGRHCARMSQTGDARGEFSLYPSARWKHGRMMVAPRPSLVKRLDVDGQIGDPETMKLGCVGSSEHRHNRSASSRPLVKITNLRAERARRDVPWGPQKDQHGGPVHVVWQSGQSGWSSLQCRVPHPLHLPCLLARATPACQLSCHLSIATAIPPSVIRLTVSAIQSQALLSAALPRHDGSCHPHNGRAPCGNGHALGGQDSLARTRRGHHNVEAYNFQSWLRNPPCRITP